MKMVVEIAGKPVTLEGSLDEIRQLLFEKQAEASGKGYTLTQETTPKNDAAAKELAEPQLSEKPTLYHRRSKYADVEQRIVQFIRSSANPVTSDQIAAHVGIDRMKLQPSLNHMAVDQKFRRTRAQGETGGWHYVYFPYAHQKTKATVEQPASKSLPVLEALQKPANIRHHVWKSILELRAILAEAGRPMHSGELSRQMNGRYIVHTNSKNKSFVGYGIDAGIFEAFKKKGRGAGKGGGRSGIWYYSLKEVPQALRTKSVERQVEEKPSELPNNIEQAIADKARKIGVVISRLGVHELSKYSSWNSILYEAQLRGIRQLDANGIHWLAKQAKAPDAVAGVDDEKLQRFVESGVESGEISKRAVWGFLTQYSLDEKQKESFWRESFIPYCQKFVNMKNMSKRLAVDFDEGIRFVNR